MSYLSQIPVHLRAKEKRLEFIHYLISMPLTFHQRLRLYFVWIDFNLTAYKAEEIDVLKENALQE